MQGAKKTAKKKTVDPYKAEVAGRIYDAFRALNKQRRRGDELTQEEMGRLVAVALGLKEPFPQATVSRWMSENNPALTEPRTVRAIARVLETDVTWLLYGATAD